MLRRSHESHELHIYGLNDLFHMLKVGAEDTTNYTGVSLTAYYPSKYNFSLEKCQFKYMFPKTTLHLKNFLSVKRNIFFSLCEFQLVR